MAVYDILPTTDLHYNDIRDTLNANDGAVNNNMASLFKESAKINRWSKHKPVAFSQPFTDNYPNWYKGNNGKCGLEIGYVNASGTVSDLIEFYKNGTWIYKPPIGGVSEPFRLGDFRGYNPNATPFFRSGIKRGEELDLNISVSDTLYIGGKYYFDSSALNISDFNQLGVGLESAHLGVMLYDYDPLGGGDLIRTVIAEDTIMNNGKVALQFNPNEVATGRYAVLFLASTTVSNNICIPYDDNNYWMAKINIKQELALDVTAQALGVVGGTQYYMEYFEKYPFDSNSGNADGLIRLSITNNYGAPITIGNTTSANYNFRLQFDGRFFVDLKLCDSSGNINNSNIQIGSKVTNNNIYFRADDIFKQFVNNFGVNTTELSGLLYIQVKSNKSTEVNNYQTEDGPYSILVSK